MLPGLSGLDICRQLREREHRVPILMLTAKSEEIDKVLGLESGADDYLTKPFSVRELVARVKAIWRRMEMDNGPEGEEQPTKLAYGDLEIDLDMRMVSLNGKRIDLTPKEFDLLSLLAQNPGRSYSRMRLLNLIWGTQFEGYEHTVNSHINRLRSKIEPDVSNPTFILTSWGYGYRFNDQIEEP
jgi:DNA-binding response OmpR family regulator